MKIAIACMMHETNTFNRHKTVLSEFNTVVGEDIYSKKSWQDPNCTKGIIDTLRKADAEIIPTYFARAIPSGPLTKECYAAIKEGIISKISQEKDLDGICLALHGSMYVDGLPDPEGDLLESMRKIVGRDIPLTCALDMHATVTAKMVEHADAMAGYWTAPHIDEYETGERSAALLLETLRSGRKLGMGFRKIPVLIAGEKSETDEKPMKELLSNLKSKLGGAIKDATYLMGYPWADSPHAGAAVLTVGYAEDRRELDRIAELLRGGFWEKRKEFEFTTEAYPLAGAVEAARLKIGRPVIISDSGDNPTAGASQDMSFVLEYAAGDMKERTLISAIADKDAFAHCEKQEPGKNFDLKVGRTSMTDDTSFVFKDCYVERIEDCQNRRVAVVKRNNLTLLLSQIRTAVYEPSLIFDMGLDPKDYEIIFVKCGYQGPEYKAVAAHSILALTPGDCWEIIEELPYKEIPRPIFPLDEM